VDEKMIVKDRRAGRIKQGTGELARTLDGQIYEVADTDKGNEVIFQNIGKIVKVSGTIKEGDEGEKIITVTSYEVEDIE
ncbi:MAG: hypothetical protein KKC23_08790, partial [Proteobacteria bacterium]|nr:hypothetical protein [Pseudomonadota bacterium]